MLEVSKAVIYHRNDYLLQLRDCTPGIVYAGYWSFFGGAIETDETPWQALQRELTEEIEWQLIRLRKITNRRRFASLRKTALLET